MRLPKYLAILFCVAALVGFADAAYLTAQHVRGVIPPCVVLNNCERVLTSAYASIGPIPVAALGVFYYGAVLLLLIAFFDTKNRRLLHIAAWLVSAGMLASLYFVYVQLFILNALCPYCLVSVLTTTIMFAVSVRIMYLD
ncbi:MAG: vitamin K epoxide reductase family protein [Candidatus Yanofskybacteria bacterium]|nr:vitamin K epoxide reductase family protein [Candidatus Yanofskybacteria bacterium]